jgi:hypothetical protein
MCAIVFGNNLSYFFIAGDNPAMFGRVEEDVSVWVCVSFIRGMFETERVNVFRWAHCCRPEGS